MDVDPVRWLSSLKRHAAVLGRPAWADGPPQDPTPPWRSYAVYSGALALRHHKSSGRPQ